MLAYIHKIIYIRLLQLILTSFEVAVSFCTIGRVTCNLIKIDVCSIFCSFYLGDTLTSNNIPLVIMSCNLSLNFDNYHLKLVTALGVYSVMTQPILAIWNLEIHDFVTLV